MNAILKYPGGKWRLASRIIEFFPAHKVYCEPFFGSGAVFFNKSKSVIETINDIDGDIVNLFRVCRDNPSELSELLSLTPWSREEFEYCYERSNNNVEQARRTFVRFWQSYGSCNHSLHSWKVTQAKSGPNNPAQFRQLPGIVQGITERLRDAQIENIDALELITRYDNDDVLLYVDPPYHGKREPNLYRHEFDRHDVLLNILTSSKSKIILSAYESDLYNTTLTNWHRIGMDSITIVGKKRVESLYMNFQPPILGLEGVVI